MRFAIVSTTALALVAALQDFRLLKLGPKDYRLVTEDAKWAMKRANINFIDYTNQVTNEELAAYDTQNPQKPLAILPSGSLYSYPKKAFHESTVKALFNLISVEKLEQSLTKFSSFYTRYYKSEHGFASANWLFDQLTQITSGVPRAVVRKVHHLGWDQFSIVVQIPGITAAKVILGSHQDSTTSDSPETNPAPGADDDGSGVVTVVEALRVLAPSLRSGSWTPHNTLEFHFYSAEEAGLLGSIDVFSQYAASDAKVLAMIQFDETGSSEGSVLNGTEKHFGLMSDYVDKLLNEYLKVIIDTYNDIPYHETSCGYACSDHASAYER
ncbi:Zn-dependent exopeptidase [Suhomyces tanzawaensis NRRL Y-17324]|uniref:Peptide hydrolase n=1 Tax=Suhomyces tanzawaensis NRRL Y-17324 TaxID=984487 RepID=A0A1E4SPK6_9ASCO|nr:Zn-dependent exopeptidase [Suhomyces tanzawaensis NRRL Y-17324]ODV81418.1 Zn-dependent exopeptidase [Suhomyces tanzawaensis NRRL Y-17324]